MATACHSQECPHHPIAFMLPSVFNTSCPMLAPRCTLNSPRSSSDGGQPPSSTQAITLPAVHAWRSIARQELLCLSPEALKPFCRLQAPRWARLVDLPAQSHLEQVPGQVGLCEGQGAAACTDLHSLCLCCSCIHCACLPAGTHDCPLSQAPAHTNQFGRHSAPVVDPCNAHLVELLSTYFSVRLKAPALSCCRCRHCILLLLLGNCEDRVCNWTELDRM